MDHELTPEEKFNSEDPERMVPRALLEGRSRESIVQELVRLDWTPEAAEALVERASKDMERHQASPDSRAKLLQECRGEWIGGALIALIGGGLSAWTFFAAISGYAGVFLFFGAVIYGLVRFSRGYARWRVYRQAKWISKK